MNGFWKETFCNPTIFWSFLEAISTLGALIFLGVQLPKLRSEIVGEKLGRLIYALDLLSSKDFIKAWESYIFITTNYSPNAWEGQNLGATIYGLLKPIELIAKLIEQKQIIQEDLFKTEGAMLANLWNMIDQRAIEGEIADIVNTYQQGMDLLSEADKWKKKNLPYL